MKHNHENNQKNNETIAVTPFEQSAGFCGPAAMKILLSHFGKTFSEDELARMCSATREMGAEHEGLVQAAKEASAFVFTKDNGTIEEIEYFIKKEGLPVIIGWFDKDGDHYSVIVNITDKNIIVVDPMEGKPERWLDRATFSRIWFDFVGKDNSIVSWRWYMVITFEKKKFKVPGGYYY